MFSVFRPMKKLLSCLLIPLFALTMFTSTVFATGAETKDKAFELIPKTESDDWKWHVVELQELPKDKDFREEYNKKADEYAQKKDKDGLGKMLASGIVTRDTILILLTKFIKFISNAALVFGSAMFIYAWYLYISSAMSGDDSWTSKANSAIKNAIIWVVIVIFSYAIERIVVEGFLS